LRGRARFEVGQQTKKDMQKTKKWIIEGDLRTRGKENGNGKEWMNWGRFNDGRPKRRALREASCN
jgi:hypothetical protein